MNKKTAKSKQKKKAVDVASVGEGGGMLGLGRFGYTSNRGERSKVLAQINRSELARVLGVHKSYASKILSGGANPGIVVMRRMAEVFGCTVDEVDRWLAGIRDKGKRKGRVA